MYTSLTSAWLQSEDLTGKLSRIYSQGTRLIRGWEEAEALQSKKPRSARNSLGSAEVDPKKLEYLQTLKDSESKTGILDGDDKVRDIDHLILVIHG